VVKYAAHTSYLTYVWGQVMNRITSLRVTRRTRDQLSELGSKDESFDEIIRRLIDFYRNSSVVQRRITRKRRGGRNGDH
jgi:hypothetical protein